MTGTTKQIKWAEDIKNAFENRVRYCYCQDEQNTEVINKALEFIANKYTDAAWWIEQDKTFEYNSDKWTELFAVLTADPDLQKLFS